MANLPRANASIAAQAFRLMELAPFSSFADETPQAQDAADQYLIARRMCLEACDWSFASTVEHLPAVVPSIPLLLDRDLPYGFALPGKCVRFLQCLDPWVEWRVDGRRLHTDAPGPLAVRFTADIDDETIMPAAFQTALSLRLAALLSPRWVGAESKTQALEGRADLMLKQAMKLDGRSASLERYDGQPWGIDDWSGWSTR